MLAWSRLLLERGNKVALEWKRFCGEVKDSDRIVGNLVVFMWLQVAEKTVCMLLMGVLIR
jgi:hypothetical protein